MQRIVNLTPHPLHFLGKDEKLLFTVRPETHYMRAFSSRDERVDTVVTEKGNIPVIARASDTIFYLPKDLRETDIYVVSYLTYIALRKQGVTGNFCFPAGQVKNSKNRTLGCKYLGVIAELENY